VLECVVIRKFKAQFNNIDILHQNGISYTFKLLSEQKLSF
jgi:hypothetical protein